MLLKWLFTLLAIIWLYQALRQLFLPAQYRYPSTPPPPSPPAPRPEGEVSIERKPRTDNGSSEYIDYEELK